jgi:type IV pilus assembly protein PilF
MRRLVAAALLAAIAAFAGCQSTTTTTQSAAPPTGTSARPTETADPEKRARVRLELASAYFSGGQPQTALEEARQALALKPDWPEALLLLASIQASLGDVAQAEASFQRVLRLAPADGDVMHNYGWFLCNQRRFAEADAQFRAAIAQPGYRETARTLLAEGICLGRNGRWEDAERTLSRSYELDAGNPVTAYNLSEVLYRRGEFERARFYVRRVNSVPDYVNAQSLWLAARVERKLGNTAGVQDYARQLRERFPRAPETAALQEGRFDE